MLDAWVTAVATELGVEVDALDTAMLLDVARDAAHNVARPAAPVTTFLLGYVAGRSGGDPQVLAQAAAKARTLATAWPAADK